MKFKTGNNEQSYALLLDNLRAHRTKNVYCSFNNIALFINLRL